MSITRASPNVQEVELRGHFHPSTNKQRESGQGAKSDGSGHPQLGCRGGVRQKTRSTFDGFKNQLTGMTAWSVPELHQGREPTSTNLKPCYQLSISAHVSCISSNDPCPPPAGTPPAHLWQRLLAGLPEAT